MNQDNELQFLLDKLRRNKGVDFSLYRQGTLIRRIASRLRLTGCADYLEYIAYLNRCPEEYDRLLEEITVNVTEFLRNPEIFAAIGKIILPQILKGRQQDPGRSIRVWCAGTSYGEEVYSIAMLFLEAASNKAADFKVKIYGTDIDPNCIERARVGLYEPRQLKEVNSVLLKKYFLKDGENYQVKDEVKQLTEFKTHDLASDQPLINLDLILCRNVVIYFTRPLQEFVYSLFLKGLNKGGFLVLGKVETLWGYAQKYFEPFDNRERIYRKII